MGRRQQFEATEVALVMEYGRLMNRFDIGRCHCRMSHNLSSCNPPRNFWSLLATLLVGQHIRQYFLYDSL